MPNRHISTQFDGELRELKDRLVAMGARCEQLINHALRAIELGDDALAREVEESDQAVNADELAIDALAYRILALRQPVGPDLRLVVAALKVVVDLERIADEAVNIAERMDVLHLIRGELGQTSHLLHEMGNHACAMIHLALDALVQEDVVLATAVFERDEKVDQLYSQVVRQSVAYLETHPEHARQGLTVVRTAKYLERAADLGTNIAEMVIFVVDAVDIRHHHSSLPSK